MGGWAGELHAGWLEPNAKPRSRGVRLRARPSQSNSAMGDTKCARCTTRAALARENPMSRLRTACDPCMPISARRLQLSCRKRRAASASSGLVFRLDQRNEGFTHV